MTADLMPTTTEASPFDAIRRTDDGGVEYWSARDLMPLLGYTAWDRVPDVIERGMAAANNSGTAGPDHFRGASKMVPIGSGAHRRIADYHLSRYGAYLVAMNSDPRKHQVASAQTYFAVKTREAETAALALTGPELLARAVLEAQAMLATKDEQIAELQPRAEVADRLLNADGDLSVADAAKALTRAGVKVGEGRLFRELSTRKWIYRSPSDNRWRVYQAAIESGVMSVIPQSHYHPKTGVLVLDPPQPRVTPKGLQRLLAAYGATEAIGDVAQFAAQAVRRG